MGEPDIKSHNVKEELNEQPRKRKTRWGQADTSQISSSGFDNMDPQAFASKTPRLTTTQATSSSTASTSIPIPTLTTPATPGAQTPATLNFNVIAAANAAREVLERVRKASLYRKQMHDQLTNLKANGLAISPQTILNASTGNIQLPRPLKLDRYGRELDDQGQIVHIKPQIHSTLKINLNRLKDEKKSKDVINIPVISPSSTQSKWFDSSISTKKARKKKGISFLEPGTYIKQEQQLMRQQEAKKMGIDFKKLRAEKQQVIKRDTARISTIEKSKRQIGEPENDIDDDSFNPNLIPLGDSEPLTQAMRSWDNEFLTLEWWDLPYVDKDCEDPVSEDAMIILDPINSYIEHPVLDSHNNRQNNIQPVVMHLTATERKKLRRRRRQEKERDKQNKIRIGITPPPPPKVKLANLMRVLGDAAVADPSRVEREVQSQMNQRLKEHEDRNQERKLTPAQRRSKKEIKWKQKDTERKALLFILKDLSSRKALFKIDINAKQLYLSGCCISCPDLLNAVIVEGGPRSIKFFKKLMLRRIQWDDPESNLKEDDQESDDEDSKNYNTDFCKLLWEGVAIHRTFSNWKLFNSKPEYEARQIFKDAKAEHYWERIMSEVKNST